MRWLEMQGKHDKVIKALKKIATTNKKSLPDLPTNTPTEVKLKIIILFRHIRSL